MKSEFFKALSLIIALLMLCSSFASCKKTPQGGDKNPTSSITASEGKTSQSDSSDTSSDIIAGLDVGSPDLNEDIILDDINSEFSDVSSVVDSPVVNDSSADSPSADDSSNVESDSEETEEDPFDYDDLFDWFDVDDLIEEEYVSPIQMVGTAVDDSNPKRKISIETDNIVFNDFLSIGGNVFPGIMSDEGRAASGMNDVYFEVEKKRFVSAKPQLNRLIFNVDYMVTNTGDEEKDGWNYNNGIYDLENDRTQACYKYIEMIESYGGLVELNYGWKAATRIQSWFSLSDTNPTGSAPYDLEGYSKACAEFVKYLLVDKGYKNIHSLCFFNEMEHATHDYDTLGDRFVYYVAMLKFVKEGLDKYGLYDEIEVWVCEDGIKSGSAEYMQEHFGEHISGYSFHEYPHAYNEGSFYSGLFNTICRMYGRIKKPIYFTEFNTGVFEDTLLTGDALKDREAVAGYRHWHWENNTTAIFMALANSGSLGASRWGYGTDYWTDPLSLFNIGESWKAHWYAPITISQINNGVNLHYYEDAILTNYVPAFSDVLQVYWEGEDIRVSAFQLNDGNYTFVVQAEKTDKNRSIEFTFDKAIGKDINKFVYKNTMARSGSANVPSLKKTFTNVGKTLTDNIDGEYGTYVYTTCSPIKQIDMPTVAFNAKAGDTVKIDASLLDCGEDDTIEWKISATEGESIATVDSKGNFIVPSDAVVGDLFAVTAYLKSDKMIFNTAVVTVVE